MVNNEKEEGSTNRGSSEAG